MKNKICITIGDINGIGIEILLNLFNQNKINNFILFTDKNIFIRYLKKNNFKIQINIINDKLKNNFKYNKINIFNSSAKNNIENSILSIKNAYNYCRKNNHKGLITLPINKELIRTKYRYFTGHTELLEKLSKTKVSNMIFIHNNLIISTLTTHIPIIKINKKISKKDFIYDKVKALNNSLINDLNIKKPKILISGINPHASENNNIGDEEKKYIIPQIIKLKKNKIKVFGPVSGDAMLIKKNLKKYSCFLFVFHDQALIPFKYISQFKGINFTSNLNLIRVSPDHGTAYELVGKNASTNNSLLNCFKLINKIYINRNN